MPGQGSPELLVVDDDPIIRLDLADRLQRRGFAVFRAGNADQAIKIIEGHPSIRAVISDMQLPGSISGLELLHEVARRWPGRRLILISGWGSPPAEEMPPDTWFLLKPASRASLDQALEGLQQP
jgi:DNA-binding NtrC family response regulator